MRHLLKNSVLGLGAIVIGVLALNGCSNTIKGAGRDMQAAGAALSAEPQKKPVHHTQKTVKTVKTTTPAGTTTTSTEVVKDKLNTSISTSPTPPTNMSGFPTGGSSSTTTTTTTPAQ